MHSDRRASKEWDDVWRRFKNVPYIYNASVISQAAILQRTKNCSTYFNTMPVLSENPTLMAFEKYILYKYDAIAFNIMVHDQPAIFELFLALYFRPNDFYAIHLDAKVIFYKSVDANTQYLDSNKH